MQDVEEFLRALGASLQEHRKAAKLTQEQVAERLGSSPEWVSQVERGVGRPSIEMLVRLAGAIGVAPSQLVLDAGEAGPEVVRVQLRRFADELPVGAVRVLVATAAALASESSTTR